MAADIGGSEFPTPGDGYLVVNKRFLHGMFDQCELTIEPGRMRG
jgi:hypothetical protein